MLRAIIFDFDGVIADTEPLHYRAFAKVLAGLSITVTPDEYFAKYVGLSDREFIQRLFKELGLPLPDPIRVRLQRAKDDAYLAMIESGLALLPGVAQFVPMAARRWPLAICSGARRVEIETILKPAGLLRHFPTVVCAEDVTTSKPDPTGFLLTLERLRDRVPRLRAEECLVIEDSAHGVAAAKTAGMTVWAVRTQSTADELAAADRIVPDLRAIGEVELSAL